MRSALVLLLLLAAAQGKINFSLSLCWQNISPTLFTFLRLLNYYDLLVGNFFKVCLEDIITGFLTILYIFAQI